MNDQATRKLSTERRARRLLVELNVDLAPWQERLVVAALRLADTKDQFERKLSTERRRAWTEYNRRRHARARRRRNR